MNIQTILRTDMYRIVGEIAGFLKDIATAIFGMLSLFRDACSIPFGIVDLFRNFKCCP